MPGVPLVAQEKMVHAYNPINGIIKAGRDARTEQGRYDDIAPGDIVLSGIEGDNLELASFYDPH